MLESKQPGANELARIQPQGLLNNVAELGFALVHDFIAFGALGDVLVGWQMGGV